MAYPTISAGYGFKPVNLMGGRVYSGSTRMFPIVSGYNSNLFNGDVVQLCAYGQTTVGPAQVGTLNATSLTYNSAGPVAATVGGTIGIFVGCEYSSPNGPIYGKNRYQYWASGTTATDAVGYVVDDPFAYFRVAVLNGGSATSSTIQYINQAYVGSNAYYVPGAGSTSTGDSGAGIAISASATSTSAITPLLTTAPFRIIQVVPDTAVNVTAAGTTSSAALTLSASNSSILPGMAVNGPGITVGSNTFVTTVNGTAVTLNQNVATNQGSAVNFTFTGYPEAIVGWAYDQHSYFQSAGV